MKLRRPKTDGFTLVELIVYLGILSVATLVFSSFLVDVIRSNGGTRNAREVAENGRFVITRMIQDIHSADSASVTATDVVVVNGANTTTFHYDAGAATLSVDGTQLNSSKIRVTSFSPTLTTVHGVQAVNLNVTFQSAVASSPPSTYDQMSLTTTAIVRKTQYL